MKKTLLTAMVVSTFFAAGAANAQAPINQDVKFGGLITDIRSKWDITIPASARTVFANINSNKSDYVVNGAMKTKTFTTPVGATILKIEQKNWLKGSPNALQDIGSPRVDLAFDTPTHSLVHTGNYAKGENVELSVFNVGTKNKIGKLNLQYSSYKTNLSAESGSSFSKIPNIQGGINDFLLQKTRAIANSYISKMWGMAPVGTTSVPAITEVPPATPISITSITNSVANSMYIQLSVRDLSFTGQVPSEWEASLPILVTVN